MRIRNPLLWIIVALALLGAFVFFSAPPDKPMVHGHALGYWLDRFREDDPQHREDIQSAIAAMDDRCIPALIDELNWKPSPLIANVNKWSTQ